ncbi:hypothetical protein N9V58_00865 [Candidatus Poseidoniales archaeon]|nr:hypothetical protein [Candidatus Poseidoniales archaeon]
MVEVNYLEYLNKMDHNQLVRLLKDHGLLEKGVLTLEDIASIVGNWVLELEGHHPRNLLKKINDQLQTPFATTPAKPTVATPALPPSPAVRPISLPATSPLLTPAPPPSIPPAVNPRNSSSESAITTERIQFQTSSELNDFAEQEKFIPPVVSILLFLLVTLSITGTFVASDIPLALSISLGLGLACLVPALMPPESNGFFLAELSAVGWIVVLFGSALSLDVSDSPTLVQELVNLSFASIMLVSNFVVLSFGVASYAIVDDKKLSTRRMANNLTSIALGLFIMALLFDNLTDGLVPAVAAITGLWGIVVIGQSRPLDIGYLPEKIAIVCLFFSMATLFASWDDYLFIYLILCVLVVGFALLSPTLASENLANLMLVYSAVFITMMSLLMSLSFPSILFHIIVLLFVLIQMEYRYREEGNSKFTVTQILSPQEARFASENHIIDSDVAILGFKGAGKTSYLAALWMILNNRVTGDLWYGSAKNLFDQRPLAYGVSEIRTVLKETADETERMLIDSDSDKEVMMKYLSHRWAQQTMYSEFRENILPLPLYGFPFLANAPRSTKKFLENFTKKLLVVDKNKRTLPDSTAGVSMQLSLSIGFPARLHESYSTFFGLGKKEKHFTSNVEKRIRCLDVPGEEVQRAVEFMDGQEIKSRSISNLLLNIENKKEREWQVHKEAIRYIVKMTAEFEHVVFMIDANEFTSPSQSSDSPVGAYLLLADRLAHLSGASLRKVTVLLNKSDELLIRGENPNRIMPDGGLLNWDELLNQTKAMQTLAEVIGPAVISRVRIPLEAYFTCTFGGVIHRGPGAPEDDVIPTYPMVPINVLEPLLRDMIKE